MDAALEEKIEQVKETLRKNVEQAEGIKRLAQFDVKNAVEDGVPNHEAYLNEAVKAMGDRFPCPDAKWDGLTSWQRLCCYKISTGVDCDAALHSTVIYQLAFGGGELMPKKKTYLLKRDGVILRGDTMNSYATTVREYIRKIWLPAHKSEMLERGIIQNNQKGGWTVSESYRDMSRDNYWDAAILAHYDYFKDILPGGAEAFFRLYHTAGNFIPAPLEFQSRGGRPVCDYWDLTLACVYHYYTGIQYPLSWIVQNEGIPVCHRWLDSFGTWNGFVERNFLQDFIGPDGTPKELWTGHFTNGAMPRDTADFEQFFTNASAWIAKRGKRVALAVQAALAAGMRRAEDEGGMKA